jgi:chromosome segregation ATPase
MATTIESRIKDAAARNRELLNVLAQTDHASAALEQQKRYVADLQNELAAIEKRLKELNWKRVKELREHEEYRDSIMKRFAFKVSGKREKFEQRAAKEEREYFEVLQQEHQATETKKNLEAMLAEANTVTQNIEKDVARHSQAQRDLDNLYDSIFKGPTPAFPEEDAKERELTETLQEYQDARTRAEIEGQALKSLQDAQASMQSAQRALQEALTYSTADMWGGGSFTDMMERNALSQAEQRIEYTRMLVDQARRFSPSVGHIPCVVIAQGSLMSDVFFDNIFTDMMFHQKIEQSVAEVQKCAAVLNRELQAAANRHKELSSGMDAKVKALEERRMALQKIREGVFDRLGEAPPAYSD